MYQTLSTEFYDHIKPEVSPVELNLYVHHLQNVSGPILEAMSGSGRLLIELLRSGFDVEGVDNSQSMLESCKKRCATLTIQPIIYEQSLQSLSLPKKYAAILVAAGSFQLLKKSEALSVLMLFKQHLKPNGFLLLDTFLPFEDLGEIETTFEKIVFLNDDNYIKATSRIIIDVGQQQSTNYALYEKINQGKITQTESEEVTVYWYEHDELVSLLKQAGFSQIEHFVIEYENGQKGYIYKAY